MEKHYEGAPQMRTLEVEIFNTRFRLWATVSVNGEGVDGNHFLGR
jgi:hypothetical protein